MTPGVARRASKSARLAPWRAATSAGISVGAEPALNGSSFKQADQRERHAGGRVRVRRIEILPAGRDPRREPEPRALALIGEGAKGDEVEIVLRRDRLQARVQHRLEPGFWQRIGVDRRAERQRDRAARRLVAPVAGDRFAPPGEPYRRQIGIARTRERVTNFRVEARERKKRRRARWRSHRARRAIDRERERERTRRNICWPRRARRRPEDGARSRRGDQRRRDPAAFRLHDIIDLKRRAGRHRFEAKARAAQRGPQRF